MPALERDCFADCMNSYISNNSDWVNVDTVISTSDDQIAIAPGSLIRQWHQNGRNYHEYRLDHFALNFYSFLSARYQVERRTWNGIDAEVYYLKEHPWNVPKMINSIEKSFGYYTSNDWIEVGALAAPEKGKHYGKVLTRQLVHMTGTHSTFTFQTDSPPDKAGIDPLLLLIDRVPDDNLKKVELVH